MFTYKEFFAHIEYLPSEEEFNNRIKDLPEPITPIEEFDYFNPDYDCLEEWIIYGGVGNEFKNDLFIDSIDLDDKTVEIEYYNNTKDALLKLKDYLDKFGWTILNFEDIENQIKIEEENKKSSERKTYLLEELRDLVTIEQLENIVKEYDNKR